ncbi:MAG: thermonuclease family protein [Candidatus Eremiobacteraeota bacterium]|nr:thermonuclease family protein [Candidatus Eremiobacteraeota bacterium]
MMFISYSHKDKKNFYSYLILSSLIFFFLLTSGLFAQQKSYQWVNVLRVIDAGTIRTMTDDGKLEIICLIGVDAPITGYKDVDSRDVDKSIFKRGKKAKEYLRSLIEKKRIKLTFDKIALKDADGNKLAYVWIDGELVNKKLLKEGYVYLSTGTSFNAEKQKEFWTAEQYAIENGIGLWDLKLEEIKTESIKAEIYPGLEKSHSMKGDKVKVIRVVDGDTIVVDLNGKKEKVRLIGINTPETVHPRKKVEYFGKEASAYTKKHLEGKVVTLTYDQNRRDKYGRLLAYVWLDNELFNEKIIREGYSYAYLKYPFRNDYMEMFRNSQRYAVLNKLGLWGNYKIDTTGLSQDSSGRKVLTPSPRQSGKYVGNKKTKVFHKSGCRHADKIESENRKYFSSKEEAINARYRACKVCNP